MIFKRAWRDLNSHFLFLRQLFISKKSSRIRLEKRKCTLPRSALQEIVRTLGHGSLRSWFLEPSGVLPKCSICCCRYSLKGVTAGLCHFQFGSAVRAATGSNRNRGSTVRAFFRCRCRRFFYLFASLHPDNWTHD